MNSRPENCSEPKKPFLRAAGALALGAAFGFFLFASTAGASPDPAPPAAKGSALAARLRAELRVKHGESSAARIDRGVSQVLSFWRSEDGDDAALARFVTEQFISDPKLLDESFDRFQFILESLDGHVHEVVRDLHRQHDLDAGPIRPIDNLFAEFSPGAHLSDDMFQSRIAFAALLNFPLTTLEERLKLGAKWSRREWAEARLAQRFSRRIPASVNQEIDKSFVASSAYISRYNVYMHHVLTADGKRLFPAGLRLLSHWNLRDELKADYNEKDPLPKQRMIQLVMEKIVRQEIPKVVVDNPGVDWIPAENRVVAGAPAAGEKMPEGAAERKVTAETEGDERYARLLANFRAVRLADPYSPLEPTFIARKFDEDREIPEAEVGKLLEAILTSPAVPRVAKLIEKQLGRPLEPFDIWYNGFRARGAYTEQQLDEIVRKKYPNTQAFQADLPNILKKLGFAPDTADFLASKVVVDPARGSGHAMGAERRADSAHLRTRIPADGMNYKGYNIAVHEFGHNVEQVFSLNKIDYFTMKGVPNTAFTEALAFVFQARDMELLGLTKPSAEARSLAALNDFWGAYEIAGVGLVDMGVWHWMYAHPEATPAQLREAAIRIAQDVWNRYYAPVFGKKDVVLLAIYSHMIDEGLYLPDYPIGHLIAFQVERALEGKNLGTEFERVARLGALTPDAWMKGATGSPLSAKPIVDAALEAAGIVEKGAAAVR